MRANYGLTQARLAKIAGVPCSTLGAIERGDVQDFLVSTLHSIAAALHVSPDYLMGLTGPTHDGMIAAACLSCSRFTAS